MPVIVIDAGGTHLRCAVACDDGSLAMYSRLPMPNFLSDGVVARVWPSIIDMVAGYAERVDREMRTGAIVFAVPGPVTDYSRLTRAPTVIGDRFGDIPDIASILSSRTGRKVWLINDVSAAAWYVSERIADDRFYIVTVSSGIGSKLFDRRHPEQVFDAKPFAGEIGHIVVDAGTDAPRCNCGGKGHLGAIASGRGTESLARCVAAADEGAYHLSSLYRWFGVRPDQITNEHHLVPAARWGDAWARQIVERAAAPLARVLAGVITAAVVDRVVLMGGFAQALGDVYRDLLAHQLARFMDSSMVDARDVLHLLEEDAEPGLAGAATFFRARCGALQ